LADNNLSPGKNQLNPGINQADFVLGLLSWAADVKFLFFLKKKEQNFFDNLFFRPIISAFGILQGLK
jgi:hypothetical protein